MQASHFVKITCTPGDPTLGLLDAYRNDPRMDRLDLDIGVYKDAQGLAPILCSVKLAKQCLAERETTKSYVGGHGDALLVARPVGLALGAASPLLLEQHAGVTQTPDGTGALCLAGDFIAHCLPGRGIRLSDPTWSIHETLFATAGLEVFHYPYASADNCLDVEAMLAGLECIPQGGAVPSHAYCHNSTGLDLSHDDWHRVFDVVRHHELLLLVGFVYQGFGDGLEEDAWAVRLFTGELPEVLIASSCLKNFGLYHDRVGALIIYAQDAGKFTDVRGRLALLARNFWLTPPTHGTEIVAAILDDSKLKGLWQEEVEDMCSCIAGLRTGLIEALAPHGLAGRLAHVGAQHGMSSYTRLSLQRVARLRDGYAVYPVSNDRASVTGPDVCRLGHLAQAIAQVYAD